MGVLRTKSVEASIKHTEDSEHQLHKRLGPLDLTVFGIGVVIGAGIFTLTGRAAHEYAGPAIVSASSIAAVCCALAALCYAEFASTVPVSGSAYTFSYATLGEMFAWIIGWDLSWRCCSARASSPRAGARTRGAPRQLGHHLAGDLGYGGDCRPAGVPAGGRARRADHHRDQGVDAGQPVLVASSCSSCCSSSWPASGSSTPATTTRSSRRPSPPTRRPA